MRADRDVIFNEKACWDWNENKVQELPYAILPRQQQEVQRQQQEEEVIPQSPTSSAANSGVGPSSPILSSPESPPLRTRRISDLYENCNFSGIEPGSFEEAEKEEVWLNAMKEEMRMIEKNKTWELVDPPTDREVIGVKWIFKTKFNQDGSIQKHKARLVARGFTQQPGIDYSETLSIY